MGGDRSSLFSTGKATPGVLGPVLDSPIQKRHRHSRESPAKGQKDDEGTGTSVIRGVSERSGTVQLVTVKA